MLASQKIIKKNYDAPEVKSALEEKDKQKIYFPKKFFDQKGLSMSFN